MIMPDNCPASGDQVRQNEAQALGCQTGEEANRRGKGQAQRSAGTGLADRNRHHHERRNGENTCR